MVIYFFCSKFEEKNVSFYLLIVEKDTWECKSKKN